MAKCLTGLVADGENFFSVVNCSRAKQKVKPIGKATTIKRYSADKELNSKIIQRAPKGANAYTISSPEIIIPEDLISKSIRIYAVQYYRIL